MKFFKKEKIEKREKEIISFDLKQDGSINLTKLSSSILLKISWGIKNVTKYDDNYEMDLCSLLLNNKKLLSSSTNCVCDVCLKTKGIQLIESDYTNHYREVIINLKELNMEVNEIVLFLIIACAFYRNQDFNNIRNITIQILDNETKQELCFYHLDENNNKNTTLKFAKIYKEKERWFFKIEEEYKKGTIADLLFEY